MSGYWIANLSLLMRLGNLETLHVRRSLLLSGLASLVYGCMHAVLPTLRDDASAAYKVTAALVLVMQATPPLIILVNLRGIKRSMLNASVQGRNVIRRCTGCYVCAAVFTLPFTLVFVLRTVGAVAETTNYLLLIASALLYGTILSCNCYCTTTETTVQPPQEINVVDDDTTSSSVDGSPEVLTDGAAMPGSTAYIGLASGSVLGIRGGLLAGDFITGMVTQSLAVKIGEGSSAMV
ncbi:hypothetical protein F441_23100 [Phytophthora nicotianae CJ01A1]|uniref:Uncharacterized protein n=2 Tax=Phytophthora nicotianae TaxID=4792 RepID=W2VP89_PHYNI|nr:hypothetical protein L916_11575 [Phytophthora nicotianae]ETO99487.1 hypothetical protein F441_23100 [Phytophthora nicotianae CJ01A1]